MPEIAGVVNINGENINGILVDCWAIGSFTSQPSFTTPIPSTGFGASVISGPAYGQPGAYAMYPTVVQDYYVRYLYKGDNYWQLAPLAGGAAGGPWEGGSGTGSAQLIGGNENAVGSYSVAEGTNSNASGDYSHAEGDACDASGTSCHAEGLGTQSTTAYDHSEGLQTIAEGGASHAEGCGSTAYGFGMHAHSSTVELGVGYAQYTRQTLAIQTTSASVTIMNGGFLDSTFNRASIMALRVIGRAAGGAVVSAWSARGIVAGDGSSSYRWIGGSPPTFVLIGQDIAAATWTVSVSISGDILDVSVAGAAATTIDWECTVEMDEVV